MLTSKKAFFALTVLAVMFALPVQAGEPENAGDTLKLGAILHLTGAFAMEGKGFREGIELAEAEINKNGGIGGKKLKVIIEDSRYTPRVAQTATKKLLNIDKVIGAVTSTYTETVAIGPEFEKAGVPLINLWDSAKEIEDIGNYVFGIGTWTPSSGEKPAEFVFNKLGAKKTALVYFNNQWSQSCAEYFKSRYLELGGEIIASFVLNSDDTDFRTILARLKASDPEAVYAPVSDHPLAFFKQYKQVGPRVPLVTSDVITSAIISEDPKAVEGIYQSLTADPDNSAAKEMGKHYKARFGKEADQLLFVSWGYDGIQLLAQALRNADSDPQKINEELYKINDFAGASGTISINEKGSSPKLASIFQVRDGDLIMVE